MDGAAFTRCKLSVRVDEHPGRWSGPLPSICRKKKRRCRRCAEMGVNLDGLKNAGPGSFLCLSLAIQITPFSVHSSLAQADLMSFPRQHLHVGWGASPP